MGSAPAPRTYNVANMIPPPDNRMTWEFLRAATDMGGGAMELHRKNLELASKMPPIMQQTDIDALSRQAHEFGLGNLLRSRKAEQYTDPATAQMRAGISQRIKDATSEENFPAFMDRWARERGLASVAASGIDPSSTVGRSAIFDATTEAGRRRIQEDIGLQQAWLAQQQAPMGGLDPSAAITMQETTKAGNIGMQNAWQQQQLQNVFGLGQSYQDWMEKMMGSTLSGIQSSNQATRDYQEMLINSVLGDANAYNQMAGAKSQGDQQMAGILGGAALGAVGLAAAAMI
jgi:hypothetical protein